VVINGVVDSDGFDSSIDCDDEVFAINPGATELPADGVDQDCDTQELCYVDSDMDTYGDFIITILSDDLSCTDTGSSISNNSLDCDDADFDVNPGVAEIFGNGIDDNCNDEQDEGFTDNDTDGFNPPEDCNDNDNTVFPGAPELLDFKDNDCNGLVDEGFDQDGDGFVTGQEGEPDIDCDDTNPKVFPGAQEIFGNDLDDNCDEFIDEEKIISPVFQADLTNKQIHKFEKQVDRWEHNIDKLNEKIIKLNEKADEKEAKGEIEKAEKLRAHADSKSEEVEILEDNIAIVKISIGEIPESDVLVHFQDKLTEKEVKKINKQIEKYQKTIDKLNSKADKYDAKAQKYEDKGKQEKADKLFEKTASLRAEAAINEDLQQVLICAIPPVPDDESPVISNIPADIVVNLGPIETEIPVFWVEPTATDNVSVASFTSTNEPGDAFELGTTIVTYTAIDPSDNTTNESFTITVNPFTTTITLEIPITQSSDDAEQEKSKMDLNSSDLDINEKKYVGLRFQNFEVPAGFSITTAYVQFTVEDDKDTGSATARIFAEDSDDAQTFTKHKKNISSRDPTSATVNWNIPNWNGQGTANSAQQTPDITSLIQEVVDRDGWNNGNSIVIIIEESSGKDRDAESYDGSPSDAAFLHVEFSTDS